MDNVHTVFVDCLTRDHVYKTVVMESGNQYQVVGITHTVNSVNVEVKPFPGPGAKSTFTYAPGNTIDFVNLVNTEYVRTKVLGGVSTDFRPELETMFERWLDYIKNGGE